MKQLIFLLLVSAPIFVWGKGKEDRNLKLQQQCIASEGSACDILFRKCERKDPDACFNYAVAQGMKGNEAEGREYIHKACALGSKDACKGKKLLSEDDLQKQQAELRQLELETARVQLQREQESLERQRDSAAYEQEASEARSKQQARDSAYQALQALSDSWNQPTPQRYPAQKQMNCNSRPVYQSDGNVSSYATHCQEQ